jgi:uncharacterized protein (TIGR03435 family)
MICGVATAQTIAAPQQMPANVSPTFEVATIKPSDPSFCCARTFGRDGRRFFTTNTNLRYLMQYAFNLQASQIAGEPAWFNEDRFNVDGEIDGEGIPTDHQWKVALQNLLIDRFHIQLHHENRVLPAYALVIAKGGSKLPKGDPTHAQSMGFRGAAGETMYGRGTNTPLTDFIGNLQRIVLDRPVVDQTGLTGTFEIQFEFTREDPQSLGMSEPPEGAPPNVFLAIQSQLGLKLQPTKAPVDVFVIDHAEKPSEN